MNKKLPTEQNYMWSGCEPDLSGELCKKFIIPPFSVLDAKQGYWQERKRQWLALGIQSELGRGEPPMLADSPMPLDRAKSLARSNGQDLMKGENVNFRQEADRASNLTGAPKKPDWAVGTGTENMAPGTSIFDPVLCEIMYRWFCPDNARILDPFAGGSVRGVVANYLGHKYTGIELSTAQVVANIEQGHKILPDNQPNWIEGDSRGLAGLVDGQFDFVFSCPPYYNLEVYSDNKQDLSTLPSYVKFIESYYQIIGQAVRMLKPNRFACFVVGDIRDKAGFYRNFVSDTIVGFQNAGATLYNEMILVTAIGSLPIRISKQFNGGRKIGKTHQNVLVFYKGNPKEIKKHFGRLE